MSAQVHTAGAASNVVAGVDVGKHRLDANTCTQGTPGKAHTFGNTAEGCAHLVAHLLPMRPALVVIEATGGYERAAVAALQEAGLAVALANPRAVRDYAKALGILAKTDRIDAAVIARFGADVKPRPLAAPDASREACDALVTRRRQLIDQRTAEQNRLEHARHDAIRKNIDEHIKFLEQQIADLDQQITQAVANDRVAGAIAKALRTTQGVGKVVSSTMVAEIPELGTIASAPPHSWASPPSTTTRAPTTATDTSAAAGAASATSSTWPPSSPSPTTRSSKPSSSACGPTANPSRSPLSPACANS